MSADRASMEREIAALQCAVRVLDGTGGGYQARERAEARDVLQNLLTRTFEEWRALASDTDAGNVQASGGE